MLDELASSLLLSSLRPRGKKFLNIFAIALINVRGNYGGRAIFDEAIRRESRAL